MSKVAKPHLLTKLAPSLSSPQPALRCGWGSHEGHGKPGQDRSQIEPRVEADPMVGEVAMAVLGEGVMAVDAAAAEPRAGRALDGAGGNAVICWIGG